MTYHAWYSEKMATCSAFHIYNKSDIFESMIYATFITDSPNIECGCDDVRYLGKVNLHDFVQIIEKPPHWIIEKIKSRYANIHLKYPK